MYLAALPSACTGECGYNNRMLAAMYLNPVLRPVELFPTHMENCAAVSIVCVRAGC